MNNRELSIKFVLLVWSITSIPNSSFPKFFKLHSMVHFKKEEEEDEIFHYCFHSFSTLYWIFFEKNKIWIEYSLHFLISKIYMQLHVIDRNKRPHNLPIQNIFSIWFTIVLQVYNEFCHNIYSWLKKSKASHRKK